MPQIRFVVPAALLIAGGLTMLVVTAGGLGSAWRWLVDAVAAVAPVWHTGSVIKTLVKSAVTAVLVGFFVFAAVAVFTDRDAPWPHRIASAFAMLFLAVFFGFAILGALGSVGIGPLSGWFPD